MVRRRINDLTYRLYDRMRHREAFRVAAQPEARAEDFAAMRDAQYAVLVSNRRDGTPVPTPVWFALDATGRRLYVHTEERTAKVRRIANDPRVTVFPSDTRGKPSGAAVAGAARIITETDAAEQAEAALAAKYGLQRRVYERVLLHGLPGVYIEVMPATQQRA